MKILYTPEEISKAIASLRKQLCCVQQNEGGDGIQSIVGGDGIIIDDSDPQNPVISIDGPSGLRFGVENEDDVASETRTFELDGNTLTITQDGSPFLIINPAVNGEEITIQTLNDTDNGNTARLDLNTSDLEASFQLMANFNDGATPSATIIGYIDTAGSSISYNASLHDFTGTIQASILSGSGDSLVGVDDNGQLHNVDFSELAETLGTGALFFVDPCNIDHGVAWIVDTDYGKCYWEAWVKPTVQNLTGYFISDGAGGAHNVLLGVATSTDDCFFTGNFYDGVTEHDMDAQYDRIPLGDWVHLAWSYNESSIVLLINGVAAYRAAYSGVRKTTPGASNGHLYVGGSYHNNFPGFVKSVRGVEGDNAGISIENRFITRDITDRILDATGTTITFSHFACDYSVNGMRSFINLAGGLAESRSQGYMTRFDADSPYPHWEATGDIIASTFIPTPPSTPIGAKVFDSFSRVNNLAMFENTATLGSTEGGSLGPLVWENTTGAFGILYGQAFNYISQNKTAVVQTNLLDVDVSVTKGAGTYISTGLILRWKDASNYYRVSGGGTSIVLENMVAGVQTFPAGYTVSSGWTTLRVTVVGTTMEVFVDGVSQGTKVIVSTAGATKHGLFGDDYVNRYDNFTIL